MKNKSIKGSALMQVLVLGALVATIVVVLLKFSTTRTANMLQTKNVVNAKIAVQGCISRLNDEETRRINEGLPPYFEQENVFHCAFDNYSIEVTRGNYDNSNWYDYSTGVVRPINFTVTFYNPVADPND